MTDTAVLQQCWAITLDLDVDDIDDESNFFDLGGDSVQAIRLAEVASERRLKLDVETVFNYPDFHDMLARSERVASIDSSSDDAIQEQLDAAIGQACADACGVGVDLIEDIFPTIGLQEMFMRAHIQTGAFMIQLVFELQGTRDSALVCQAFDLIRAKNQALRTRLVQMDTEVLQVALKDPIIWHNATNLEEYAATDSSVRKGYGQPLVRYAVVQESEKTYVVWTCHHSVMDGWTRRLLLDDLESYLANPAAFTAKRARPPFKSLVDYQRSLDAEEANAFWRRYFGELPHTKTLYTIPEDYKPSRNHTTVRVISIDRPTRSAFTVSNMAQVAFALALAQVTGSHETTLIIVRGSRGISMRGAESIMGPMLSGIVPLYVLLSPEEPVSTVLRRVQDTSTLMLRYELFSQEHAARERKLENHIRFNWFPLGSDLSSRVAEFRVGNEKASLRVVQEQYPKPHNGLGSLINIYDNGDHLRVTSRFDDHVLKASLLEKVLDLFATKLASICAGQEMSVQSLMT